MNNNYNNQMAFNPMDTLRRRKWQLAASLMLVCVLAACTVTVFAPKYEAEAQVKVVTSGQTSGSSLSLLLGGNSSFNSQYELLKSDRVFEQALARINSNPTIVPPMKMLMLRDHSKLRADANASLIKIVGVSENAEVASAIANNLANAFIETSTVMKNAQANTILDQLTDQLLLLEKQVNQKETELEQFRKENMIIGNNTSYENSIRMINELQQKLQLCETRKAEINNELEVLQKITMNDLQDPMSIPVKSIKDNANLASQLKALNDLVSKEREYSRIYLPGHRELQNINQKITIARDNMARNAQNLLISLQKQNIESLANIEKEKETLTKSIEVSKNAALQDGEVNNRLNKINTQLAEARKSRDQIHTEIQQFKLKDKLSSDPVVVVNAANVPEATAGLSARKRAGSVLLLGVIFSFLLIFSLEKMKVMEYNSGLYQMPVNYMPYPQFNPNFNMYQPTKEQYDNTPAKKHFEVLGRISSMVGYDIDNPVNESMLYNLVHTYPHSRQAEQYREISTTLLSRFNRTRQSIVITGNEPKCGKTVLTCNLALLMSQAGRNVLIISTNPTSDKLSKAFDTGKTMYCDLLLSGKYDINDYICTTGSGHISTLKLDMDNRPGTAELSQAISGLNWKLQSEFDWILYDTTSIGYNDTDNILQVIGKAIFVSRSSSTENVIMTTEQIEQRGAVSLGCVEMPSMHNTANFQHA